MNDYKMEEYGKLLHDKKVKFKYNNKKIVAYFLNDIKNNTAGSFVLWVQQEQNKKKSNKQREKELYKEFNIKKTSEDALSKESYIIVDMIQTLRDVDKENE